MDKYGHPFRSTSNTEGINKHPLTMLEASFKITDRRYS